MAPLIQTYLTTMVRYKLHSLHTKMFPEKEIEHLDQDILHLKSLN